MTSTQSRLIIPTLYHSRSMNLKVSPQHPIRSSKLCREEDDMSPSVSVGIAYPSHVIGETSG